MKQKKIGNKLYVYSEEPYVITEDTDVDIIYVQEEVINEFKEINIDLIDKFDTINYNVTCVTKPEWADYYNDFTVYVEQTTGGTVIAYPTSGDEGEEIQVSHISSEKYVFDHWNIVDEDGNEIEVNNGKFLMPASNVTVSATFVQQKYSVSIEQTTHGTVTSDKQSAYEDETITLTVTSDTGYSLDELIVVDEDGNDIEVINNQFIMPASNVTVSATFIQTVFSITINDTEHGTITSDKQNAARGEIVTLTITPDAEYELDILNVIDANSNPITVTNNQFIMPSSDVTVSATFKQEFTITINDTTHGSVTSDKYIANQGEVITLTITPDSEYRLDSLTVLDRNSNPITVTNNQFIMPASNVTVSAVFSIITYDITIGQTTHGTVTSDKQTAAWGETVTLTVNPDTDYVLNQLTVVDTNYNPISVINNQFLMPASDVIVNATFSQIEYAISIDQTTHGSVSTNKQIATQGETITLTITPDADYELNTLTVVDANSNPITVTNNQFIMPRSNVYIDATFNAITYTISVGQTTHGTVTSNKQTASVGETVTLTINPDTNYELDTLTVVDANGNDIPVINNQFIMVRSNVTVSATFSMITYTISVGQTTHGTVTSNKQTASVGETVTLTINPDSDYELNTLTVVDANDNPITVTNNQFIMPTSNVTVSATFSMITYTISIGQTTHGTVTSNKQTASVGETVTLTITPDSNYELNILTVVDANSNPITVTNNQFIMPRSNVYIDATFNAITYTISVGQTTHGTVTSNKQTAVVGETVTFTITPDSNYELNTLTVVDANSNPITVTNNQFIMPGSNVTVSATFSMITYTISIGQTTHGTVTSNKQTASVGETVTLTITPDSNYELNTLTVVDANSNPITVTNNQFIMPGSNVTVSATFSMITYTISIGQTTHGTVTSNKQTASVGETVTLTITPDSNYELNILTVVDANSNPITVTNNQFIMPSSDVTVSAAFVQVSYDKQYLTIESQADNNTISWKSSNASYTQDIQYSTDLTNWTTVTSTTSGATLYTLNNGDKLYLKGLLVGHNSNSYYESINSSGNFIVYGNIMSLIYGDNFTNQTTLTQNYQLCSLFRSSKVTDASNLVLPATTLTNYCYRSMFEDCTSLTTSPALPATTLTDSCYQRMFYGCTSLTTATALPATTLDSSCYFQMFYECTSLTTAPELPATTLTDNCYNQMFTGCTSLTTVPVLSAITLASNCYRNMFNGCTSLITAPALSATTLANSCCYEMFKGCTSLITAPALPATTLDSSCYFSMFYGCTSLTTAPELPATTLTNYCYNQMFRDCTSLTTAPELPATTLTQRCYFQMFYGCTSLNSITMLATDISASNCLWNWVSNVSATGTFTKTASMTTLPTGQNGIPSGWTVVDA